MNLFRFLLSSTLLAAGNAYLREESAASSSLEVEAQAPPFPHPKAVCFGEEKGVRCHGGMKDEKGGMECEAGMRKNFTASFKSQDMVSDVASTLHSQMMDVLPSPEFFLPPDEALSQMFDSQNDFFDDWFTGMNEQKNNGFNCKADADGIMGCEMAFGGKAHMEYGCKVSFEKKGATVTKHVECGIKGVTHAGKADGTAAEEEPFHFVMPKVLD
eukprot:CAMPEP_0172442646 /NCGR_PEP_ID=MMETSP1065-20121228/3044_1 /TAXON_ID=265537 /ORGANISM="Amphiprora paludosa, Strain CCMP125" /LENGTH=213 /DNA_ID=CAMNT_0013192593 /DNA_START=35 /DNA_END=676 /DNA_ORIENTATION=+